MSALRERPMDELTINEINEIYEVNTMPVPRRGRMSERLYKAVLMSKLRKSSANIRSTTREQRDTSRTKSVKRGLEVRSKAAALISM